MLCTRDLLTLLCSSKSGFTLKNADLCPLCVTLQLREKMLTWLSQMQALTLTLMQGVWREANTQDWMSPEEPGL